MQNACSARQTGCIWESRQSSTESKRFPSPTGAHVSPLNKQIGAGFSKSSTFWPLDFDVFA